MKIDWEKIKSVLKNVKLNNAETGEQYRTPPFVPMTEGQAQTQPTRTFSTEAAQAGLPMLQNVGDESAAQPQSNLLQGDEFGNVQYDSFGNPIDSSQRPFNFPNQTPQTEVTPTDVPQIQTLDETVPVNDTNTEVTPAQVPQDWWKNIPQEETETNQQGISDAYPTTLGDDRDAPVLPQRNVGHRISEREREAQRLATEPIQKQKWWKDALYKIGTIASNGYQGEKQGGGIQLPVQGYGRAQRNKQIGENNQALGNLYGIRNQQQQQEKFESDQATEAERRKLLQAQQGNIATDNADAATRLKQRDIAEFWKETARYGYDPTSPTGVSPTQKALIEKYPELANMPKRRASNAKLIEINGVRLEQQPDGSYREAGLPMEKRNQEELFEVTDANGNKFSYWMTSQAAGKTRADLIKEGYKIEAANADKQETIEQQNRKGKQDYDQDLLTQQETINKSSRQIEANNLRIAGLEKEIAQKSVSNLPISKVDKDGNETQTGGVIDTTALSNQVTALEAENIVLQGNITNANTRLDYLKKNPFKPREFTPTQTISGQTVQTGGGNVPLDQQRKLIGNRTEQEWVDYTVATYGSGMSEEQKQQLIKNAKEAYKKAKQ